MKPCAAMEAALILPKQVREGGSLPLKSSGGKSMFVLLFDSTSWLGPWDGLSDSAFRLAPKSFVVHSICIEFLNIEAS